MIPGAPESSKILQILQNDGNPPKSSKFLENDQNQQKLAKCRIPSHAVLGAGRDGDPVPTPGWGPKNHFHSIATTKTNPE